MNIKREQEMSAVDDVIEGINRLKKLEPKAVNGDKYVDYNKYISPSTTDKFGGESLADPTQYTDEMLEAFKKKCKGCMNEGLSECCHRGRRCFDSLFNPVPYGFHAFCINRINRRWHLVDEDYVKKLYEQFKSKNIQ